MYEPFDFDKLPFEKIEKSYASYQKHYAKMAKTLGQRGDTPYVPEYTYDEFFDQWVMSHDQDAKSIGTSKNFPRELASRQMYKVTAAQARALAEGLISAGLSNESKSKLKLDIRREQYQFNGKSVWTEIERNRSIWMQEALDKGATTREAKSYAAALVSQYFFGSPD